MSVSMWSYRPEVCDGGGCPGDCDLCDKPKNMEDEDEMSVSKWAYDPMMCDGDICVGDCDLCDKPKIAQIHNTATTQVPTDYIKREDAIEAACMGCNDDFSNEPCEPSDCDITKKIMELPSADVMPKTKEAAIDYLHYIGWMQEHDKEMTAYKERGKKHE